LKGFGITITITRETRDIKTTTPQVLCLGWKKISRNKGCEHVVEVVLASKGRMEATLAVTAKKELAVLTQKKG